MQDKQPLGRTIYVVLVVAWSLSSAQFLIEELYPGLAIAGTLMGVISALLIVYAFNYFRTRVDFTRTVSNMLVAALILLLVYAVCNAIGTYSLFDSGPNGEAYWIRIIIQTISWTGAALLMAVGFYSAVNDSTQVRLQLLKETDKIQNILKKNQSYQRRIEENEKRLKNIFGVALDGVIDADENGNIINWNSQAEAIFGWTRIEALRNSMADMIIPEQYREAHTNGMKHFVETGEGPVLNTRIEITALRKSGEEFPVELGITPIRVADEWQFTAFVRDISERKDAERELAEISEQRESALERLQTSQELVERERDRLSIERERLAQIAVGSPLNEELTSLCELLEEEDDGILVAFVGIDEGLDQKSSSWHSSEHVPTIFDDNFVNGIRDLHTETTPVGESHTDAVREISLTDSTSGSMFSEATTIGFKFLRLAKFYAGEDSSYFICLLLREQSSWNEEVRESFFSVTSLAKIAIQQYANLSALETARFEAEQGNIIKSEFLAHVSHDLRTPLTAIIGYADLLTDIEERSAEDILWAQRILRNAGHLKQLLDDLIDLARVDAGKIPVVREPTNIRRLVRDIYEIFESQAREKLLDYEMNISTSIPDHIITDKTRLRQILSNLVSNAVKFTTDGSITISLDSEVDSTPDEPDVEKLRIEVSDTGIGIDPRITAKMFESFVRARSSEHTVSGTGLGLSIVQKMSELLGGSVRVNANPQGGSRFIVTLPILLGDAESAEVQHEPVVSSPSLMPNESMKSLRNSRILIVDDNPENRLLFRFMIEKFGAQSEYAINGADAVDRIVTTLKTNPFDAILMDVQMPIMDGRSATRHLREIGVETPIIALTAHASKSEKNACIESGCSDFLPKPVSRELLQEVLLLHLSDSTETRNLHDPLPQTDKPIAMEDDEEFAAIKKKYVASLKTHSMNLRDATENKNVESIRQISHKIRGTASSYGFEQLSQLAETLELAILSAPEQLPSSSKILALIEALDEATQ